MNKNQMKLLKDLHKVRKQKFFLDGSRACVSFQKGDISDTVISVMPVHGPFKDCLVRFNLKFPNYQVDKPSANCLTKIYHPNISSSGSICYSLFGQHWSRDFWLVDYINGLVYLLLEPNHNSPLNGSCVIHDRKRYHDTVQNAAEGKLGTTYDTCKVDFPIEDSLMLSKHSEKLIHLTNIKEFNSNLEKFLAKIDTNMKSQVKSYEILKFCYEKARGVYQEIKKFSEELDMEEEEFDVEKIQSLESFFTQIMLLSESVYSCENNFRQFWNEFQGKYDKKHHEKAPIQGHLDRVSSQLEQSLPRFREAMGLVPTLLEGPEVTKVEIHLGIMSQFKNLCNSILSQENANLAFLKRVYSRMEGYPPEYFEHFEKNEFRVLSEDASLMYEEMNIILGEENVEERNTSKKRFDESTTLLRIVREQSGRFLDMEYENHLLGNKVKGCMVTDAKATDELLRICKLSKICTFKCTGKKYVKQEYKRCGTCGIDVCVSCAECCHQGHELHYANSSKIFCDCGETGFNEKCALKDKPFTEEYLSKFLKDRKLKLQRARHEIRILLDQIHPLVGAGERREVDGLQMKIRSLLSDAEKL